MNTMERRLFKVAMSHSRAPYIWKAKGLEVADPPKPLQPLVLMNPMNGKRMYAFDCSGFVTYCLWQCGHADWRASHRSQSLSDVLKQEPAPDAEMRINFYGTDVGSIVHVGFGVKLDGEWYVLDAGGGDSTTLHLAEAQRRMAFVHLHPAYRTDLVRSAAIPLSG